MALTLTARGSGNGSVTSGSFTFSPGSNFASGSLAILCVAYDNSGSSGADPFTAAPTDNGTGNEAWISRQNALQDPGAASAGAVMRIFTSRVGTLGTAQTITWCTGNNNGANNDKVAWTLWEAKGTLAGGAAGYVTGNQFNGSGTAFTISTGIITNADAVICAIALEDSSSGADDTDTTNGSWSAGQSSFTSGGGGAGNMGTRSQYKIVTATGGQTWNFTVANTDWAAAYIVVRQQAVGSFTVNAVIKRTVATGIDIPSVVGSPVTNSVTSNQDMSFTIPSGIRGGDLLVLAATAPSGTPTSYTTPTGWNAVSVVGPGATTQGLARYWRTAVASDAGATVTVHLGSAVNQAGVLVALRSTNFAATPVVDAATTNGTGSTVTIAGTISPAATRLYGAIVGANTNHAFSINERLLQGGIFDPEHVNPVSVATGSIASASGSVVIGLGTIMGAMPSEATQYQNIFDWTNSVAYRAGLTELDFASAGLTIDAVIKATQTFDFTHWYKNRTAGIDFGGRKPLYDPVHNKWIAIAYGNVPVNVTANAHPGSTLSAPTSVPGPLYARWIATDGTTWFVIAGMNTSNDGLIWTATDPAGTWTNNASIQQANQNYWAVAFGNGKWVMGTDAGAIYTADDPSSTWTLNGNTSPFTSIKNIKYANGYWVAVGSKTGNAGCIAYATNPTGTWTEPSSYDPSALNSGSYPGYTTVENSRGYWIATGYETADNKIWVATDPTGTWTTYATAMPTSDSLGGSATGQRGIAISPQRFGISGGRESVEAVVQSTTTSDPTSGWAINFDSAGTTRIQPRNLIGLTYNSGAWVTFGDNYTYVWYAIEFSADAVLQKNMSGSFTIDARIGSGGATTVNGSFTADAVLFKTISGAGKSFTVDAVIKATITPAVSFPMLATSVTDDFNRADENPIGGPNWDVSWWAGAEAQVKDDKFYAPYTGTNNTHGANWSAAQTGDFEAVIEVLTAPSATGDGWFIGIEVDPFGKDNWAEIALLPDKATISKADTLPYIQVAEIATTATSEDAIGLRRTGTVVEGWYKPGGGNWVCLGRITDLDLAGDAYIHIEGDSTTHDLYADNFRVASGTASGMFVDAVIRQEQTGSFTAKAVLFKTVSASFTADADLNKTIAGSATADAVLLRASSGSISANANLLRTIAATLTADADIKRTQTGSFTANAVLLKTIISSGPTFDAVLLRTQVGSVAIEAVLIRTLQSSLTTDAVLLRASESSFVIEAALAHTITGSLATDADIKRTLLGSAIADAVLLRIQTGSATANATVRVGQADSFTIDALIVVGTLSGSFTADAVVLRAQTGIFTIDGYIEGVGVFAFGADAVIKRTQTGSITIDAVSLRSGNGTITADADLLRTQVGAATADAVIKRAITGSATVDAVMLRTQADSYTINAVSLRNNVGTTTANAVLRTVVAGSATADAVLQRTLAGSFTADAFVAGQISADAVVRRTQTNSWTVDAFVPGHFAMDAVLRRTQMSTFTIDAFIQGINTYAIGMDAVLRKTQSASFTADAVQKQIFQGQLTADAVLRAIHVGNLSSDATIRRLTAGSFTASAVTKATRSQTFVADALLRISSNGSVTAGAVLLRAVQGNVVAQAVLFSTQSGTFTLSAVRRVSVSSFLNVDALIVKRVSASITANAVILAPRTDGVTANAVIRSSTGSVFTIDAYLRQRNEGSFTLDAVLVAASGIQTFTVDAVVLASQTGSFIISALVRIAHSGDVEATLTARLITADTTAHLVESSLSADLIASHLAFRRVDSFAVDAVIV